jgi:hypothetical protein
LLHKLDSCCSPTVGAGAVHRTKAVAELLSEAIEIAERTGAKLLRSENMAADLT